ncbi:MAG: YtoQ family protein [Phycisphaerales bacterium JB063]
MADPKTWRVYLAGEVHSDWREQVRQAVSDAGLPVVFTGPVTDHDASDGAGDMLGTAPEGDGVSYGKTFWRDRQSAGVNAIRTRTLLAEADVVVVRFGEQYKQWNAAFDAGYASALGKPVITLHAPSLTHALKEVDAAASAVAQTPGQVAEVLRYVIAG